VSDSLVIIPTYNEIENINEIINTIQSLEQPFHILIVDDGSPDGTAQAVKTLQKNTYPDTLHLLERPKKSGLGTAYIAGFRFGIEKKFDYIFEMDADFSHKPKDLIRLRQECHSGEADVCIGSRYVRGGQVVNWPKDRLFLSKGASYYVQLLTWMPVKDSTGGFKCYRREVLEAIDLSKIEFIGYAFQIQMKYAAWTLGYKLKEIPITFADREKGTSKMNLSIVKEAIFGVIKLRLGTLFSKNKYARVAKT